MTGPGRGRRTWRCVAGLCGVAGLIMMAGSGRSLRVNLTQSLPVGVYRVVAGPPTRGALVLVCLPPAVARFALTRRYVWRGGGCTDGAVPIGKIVLAMGGDTVTVTPAGLSVNGRAVPHSRPLARDTRGRPLPHYPYGPHVLPCEALWLFSPYHPRSFDSRYFGPVATADVLTRVVPVWTMPSGRVGEVYHRGRQ